MRSWCHTFQNSCALQLCSVLVISPGYIASLEGVLGRTKGSHLALAHPPCGHTNQTTTPCCACTVVSHAIPFRTSKENETPQQLSTIKTSSNTAFDVESFVKPIVISVEVFVLRTTLRHTLTASGRINIVLSSYSIRSTSADQA